MALKNNYVAHLLIIGANLIYGVNYSVSKSIMPHYIHPLGLAVLRVLGALLVFWLISLGIKERTVKKKHIALMALCGLFGVALNQMLFLMGLNLTTPIDASIIMTVNPAIVLVLAAIFIGEYITPIKITGLFLGAIGALGLILYSSHGDFGSSTFIGNLLMLGNTTSYALYLVLVKPLMKIYNPIIIMRWVFLFGAFVVVPSGISNLLTTQWSTIPTYGYMGIIYVVLFTTVFAYILNITAMQIVSPTVVSSYIYTQPIIATIVAIFLGQGQLTIITLTFALIIFTGMYLVSKTYPAVKFIKE